MRNYSTSFSIYLIEYIDDVLTNIHIKYITELEITIYINVCLSKEKFMNMLYSCTLLHVSLLIKRQKTYLENIIYRNNVYLRLFCDYLQIFFDILDNI